MKIEKFTQIQLSDLVVGEPLPGAIYLYIDLRYLAFRVKGDVIDRNVFERLELRKASNLFVSSNDHQKFKSWKEKIISKSHPLPKDAKEFLKSKKEIHREVMDIFTNKHPSEVIQKAIGVSKKVTEEVLKAPFSVRALSQIQSFSSDIAHHSTNVSVLSTYLALQLGYAHIPILQHIAMGGLLHDIGKTQILFNIDDPLEVSEKKMEHHPIIGAEFLINQHPNLPEEVLLIVSQHHERHDGTGFPKRLRGNKIYDLAKIVGIANEFDGLVVDASGTLHERQTKAVKQLGDILYFNKFEYEKHEKAVKVLSLGI